MNNYFYKFLAKAIIINRMYEDDNLEVIINEKVNELDALVSKLTTSQLRACIKLMRLVKSNKESWDSRRKS
jgi:hypothetical protein